METEVLKEQHYVEELVDIIRSGLPKEELIDRLSDYHDNDIADALTKLTPDERRELYPLIGVDKILHHQSPDPHYREHRGCCCSRHSL